MRTPSWSARVLMSETRAIESECTSAARLRLTREAICWAVCTALGSNSSARKVCNQATILPMSSSESRKKVLQNRDKPTRGRISSGAGAVSSSTGPVTSMLVVTPRIKCYPSLLSYPRLLLKLGEIRGLARSVRYEDVTHAPHGLDVARRGRVHFHKF